MKMQSKNFVIGDVVIKASSETYLNTLLDTKIEILPDGGTLCWIAGITRENFIQELKQLIEKYRI